MIHFLLQLIIRSIFRYPWNNLTLIGLNEKSCQNLFLNQIQIGEIMFIIVQKCL